MKLKKNIGTPDRILRLVIAVALLVYAFNALSWIALAVGLFVLVESLLSWCVLYQLLGKNTCPLHTNKK